VSTASPTPTVEPQFVCHFEILNECICNSKTKSLECVQGDFPDLSDKAKLTRLGIVPARYLRVKISGRQANATLGRSLLQLQQRLVLSANHVELEGIDAHEEPRLFEGFEKLSPQRLTLRNIVHSKLVSLHYSALGDTLAELSLDNAPPMQSRSLLASVAQDLKHLRTLEYTNTNEKLVVPPRAFNNMLHSVRLDGVPNIQLANMSLASASLVELSLRETRVKLEELVLSGLAVAPKLSSVDLSGNPLVDEFDENLFGPFVRSHAAPVKVVMRGNLLRCDADALAWAKRLDPALLRKQLLGIDDFVCCLLVRGVCKSGKLLLEELFEYVALLQ
jgi:hypothetical protein